MFRVNFTLKAFQVGLIAFFISFAYAMGGFALFVNDMNEDILNLYLMPTYIIMLGLLLIIIESWWRLSDPKASMIVMGLNPRAYGVFLVLIGLYTAYDDWHNIDTPEFVRGVLMYAGVSIFLVILAYVVKRQRHHESHETPRPNAK